MPQPIKVNPKDSTSVFRVTHEAINRLKDTAGNDTQEIVIEGLPKEMRVAVSELLSATYALSSDRPPRSPQRGQYKLPADEVRIADWLAVKVDNPSNRTTLKIIGAGDEGLPAYQMEEALRGLHTALRLGDGIDTFPVTHLNFEGVSKEKPFVVVSFPDRNQAQTGLKLYFQLAQAQGFTDPDEIFSLYDGIEIHGKRYPSVLISKEVFQTISKREKAPDLPPH